jgi:dipeptide transport system ATP-binding protein
MPLLEIEELNVTFPSGSGTLRAVDQVSLSVDEGEVLGIVGESGSGKSVSMLAVLGLVSYPGKVTAKSLRFRGLDLLSMPKRQRRQILGKEIAVIFQDPGTSLNPSFTVGFQLCETLKLHEGMSTRAARARSVSLLEKVGIPEPESRLSAYPHQLSGGMNQRVMIAMAIACNPKLLIADEPTTALDVTVQAQILDMLVDLQKELGMSLILITHNMGVVAEVADRIAVMYAGQVVEEQPASRLFQSPQHPYTAALLDALPERAHGGRLLAIPGVVPGIHDRPPGCLFAPRCRWATSGSCNIEPPLRAWQGGRVRCHFPLGDPERNANRAADRAPDLAEVHAHAAR